MIDENAGSPDPREFADPSPNPAGDATLTILCDALQELGVSRAAIDYDGYGDSGGIDGTTYEPEGTQVPDRFDRSGLFLRSVETSGPDVGRDAVR